MYNSTGFKGKLSNTKYVNNIDMPEIDFYQIAKNSLDYLKNNPIPDNGYECR